LVTKRRYIVALPAKQHLLISFGIVACQYNGIVNLHRSSPNAKAQAVAFVVGRGAGSRGQTPQPLWRPITLYYLYYFFRTRWLRIVV
jgi:hypothetical protein